MPKLAFRAALLTLALAPSPALAQSGGTALAESLFQEGRELIEAGNYAAGCPKLEESQRLDPATGTLLAVALCHEQLGKFASAWAEFTAVEGRARREGRSDRETAAREHATALKPRLSTLTVSLAAGVADTPGLELRLDGVVLGRGSLGVAAPVDGGEHTVEATAPGRAPFKSKISVRNEKDAARVEVPPLETSSAPAAAEPRAGASPAAPDGAPASGGWMRPTALVVGGVGVVALGVGSFLGLDAKSKYDSAKKHCDGTVCSDPWYGDAEDARDQGTIATVLFAAGGAAVAAGVTLWLVAPSSKSATTSTRAPKLERVSLNGPALMATGSF